jgi:XisI protein
MLVVSSIRLMWHVYSVCRLHQRIARTIAPTPNVEHVVIADHEHDQYLLLFVGWSRGRRLLERALYIRIRNGKVWLEAIMN